MLHDLRKKLCTAKAIGQRQVSPRGHRVVPELFGPLAIVRVLTLCPVDGREKFAPLPPGLDPNLPLYAVPKLSVAVGLPQAVHCAKVLLGDGANLREENPSALDGRGPRHLYQLSPRLVVSLLKLPRGQELFQWAIVQPPRALQLHLVRSRGPPDRLCLNAARLHGRRGPAPRLRPSEGVPREERFHLVRRLPGPGPLPRRRRHGARPPRPPARGSGRPPRRCA